MSSDTIRKYQWLIFVGLYVEFEIIYIYIYCQLIWFNEEFIVNIIFVIKNILYFIEKNYYLQFDNSESSWLILLKLKANGNFDNIMKF